MSKDEARKLLGGYATGSLTEAERRMLFEAALKDQELFDELAGEQVLKEVLDEPGARQRLIAALEPPRRHRAWLWATAAATVAVAVVIGVVVSQRTPPPLQQIAQVMKSPEPAAAPVTPAPAAAPLPPPPKLKVAPAPAPLLGPPAPPELKKEETATLAEQADQVQPAKPQPASEALRLNGVPQALQPPRLAFGFRYSVGDDGILEVTPSPQGFLSVTAGDAVIFPSTAVDGGYPTHITIPSGATSLVIAFSRMQGITGTPVRSDAVSGFVTDQDPPNGKILIELFLTPGTR